MTTNETTRTSHSTCHHDSTAAARRRCRASRSSGNDSRSTTVPGPSVVTISQRDGVNYRGRVVTVTCKNGVVVRGELISWGRQVMTVVPDAESQERLGRTWKRESIHNFSIHVVTCDNWGCPPTPVEVRLAGVVRF